MQSLSLAHQSTRRLRFVSPDLRGLDSYELTHALKTELEAKTVRMNAKLGSLILMFEEPVDAAQIKAADDFGGNGWMLWSPSNEYHVGGIAPE